MKSVEISVEIRPTTGKEYAKRIRREGTVPAVAYGKSLKEPLNLLVESRQMALVLNESELKQRQVTLKVDGKELPALIRSHQKHPVSRMLVHVDFQILDENTPITVSIPAIPVGRAKGEGLGGRKFMATHYIKVKCLPKDQPESIELDIENMMPGDILMVDDIEFPEGVVPIYKARYPVFLLEKAKSSMTAEDEAAEAGATPGEETEGEEAPATEGGEE